MLVHLVSANIIIILTESGSLKATGSSDHLERHMDSACDVLGGSVSVALAVHILHVSMWWKCEVHHEEENPTTVTTCVFKRSFYVHVHLHHHPWFTFLITLNFSFSPFIEFITDIKFKVCLYFKNISKCIHPFLKYILIKNNKMWIYSSWFLFLLLQILNL